MGQRERTRTSETASGRGLGRETDPATPADDAPPPPTTAPPPHPRPSTIVAEEQNHPPVPLTSASSGRLRAAFFLRIRQT